MAKRGRDGCHAPPAAARVRRARAPAAAPLPRLPPRAEGEGHTEDQESTMDMYITALQPAPATPGPRSGDCLDPDPEAGGTANKNCPDLSADLGRQVSAEGPRRHPDRCHDRGHLAPCRPRPGCPREWPGAMGGAVLPGSKISASCRRDGSWQAPA